MQTSRMMICRWSFRTSTRPELSRALVFQSSRCTCLRSSFGSGIIPHKFTASHVHLVLSELLGGFHRWVFPSMSGWGIHFFGFRDLIASVDCTDHVSASGWNSEALVPFRRLNE